MTPALTCDELRPLLGGYVLEALEPDEAEAVRAHLPGLPRLRRRARLAGRAAARCSTSPRRSSHPDEPLSPSFEEALLDRFARESETAPPRAARRAAGCRGSRWTRPRVAVASALLAAALAVAAMPALDGGDRPAARPRATTSWRCKPAPARAAGERPRIALYRVQRRHRRAPVGERPPAGLEAGLRDAVREASSWSASAGTFRADAHGRVEVRLTTAARVGEYDRVRVVTKDRDGHHERRPHRAPVLTKGDPCAGSP